MERILEPELMDDEQQSVAYAQADFSTSNQFFVDSLVRDFPTSLREVVDIGCGPADVVIRLARAAPDATRGPDWMAEPDSNLTARPCTTDPR